jgi:hypothetical protein
MLRDLGLKLLVLGLSVVQIAPQGFKPIIVAT